MKIYYNASKESGVKFIEGKMRQGKARKSKEEKNQPSLLGMHLDNKYEPKEADSVPFLEHISTCKFISRKKCSQPNILKQAFCK